MTTRGHEQAPRRRSRAPRSIQLAVLALCLAVGGLTSFASPAGAAEGGVVLTTQGALQAAETTALGGHWVRMFATWPDLEPQRGVYAPNWVESYETTIKALPPGTKVILDVVGTPKWETGSSDEHTPPANPAEYGALLAFLAHRYGSMVTAYEIWNEEDASRWWSGGPNPAAYVQLLKATYPAIKAAFPSATVVMGGLTGNDFQFLERVYQDGGKGYFDVVGVHTDTSCNILSPYEFLRGADHRLIADSFLAYREVHAVMLANGDEKPIWMTEMSWRTTNATCAEGAWAGQKAGGVSEARQALYLRQAYHCLKEDPYVQVALWFGLQDQGVSVSGLLRANGSRKPSFDAMKTYMREGDTLTGTCGVFTGPKITVASPHNKFRYSGKYLPIKVSARSTQGVFRIRLLIDGKLIRNYDNRGYAARNYPPYLSGAINWIGARSLSYGRHTLSFIAYDRQNNISRVNVLVIHARPGGAKHHP